MTAPVTAPARPAPAPAASRASTFAASLLPRTLLPEQSTARALTPPGAVPNFGTTPDALAPPKPPGGAGGRWDVSTRAADGREFPPIPETADRRYIQALGREVLRDHFGGGQHPAAASVVMRDPAQAEEFDRLMRARYWRTPR